MSPKEKDVVLYHPAMRQILRTLVPAPGGAVLPEKDFAHWAGALAKHKDRKEIAIQLVAMAIQFEQKDCHNTTVLLAMLATACLGSTGAAEQALTEAGMEATRVREVVAKSHVEPAGLPDVLGKPVARGATLRGRDFPKE